MEGWKRVHGCSFLYGFVSRRLDGSGFPLCLVLVHPAIFGVGGGGGGEGPFKGFPVCFRLDGRDI